MKILLALLSVALALPGVGECFTWNDCKPDTITLDFPYTNWPADDDTTITHGDTLFIGMLLDLLDTSGDCDCTDLLTEDSSWNAAAGFNYAIKVDFDIQNPFPAGVQDGHFVHYYEFGDDAAADEVECGDVAMVPLFYERASANSGDAGNWRMEMSVARRAVETMTWETKGTIQESGQPLVIINWVPTNQGKRVLMGTQ